MHEVGLLPKELNTLRDVIRWAATQFSRANVYFGHGTDNAVDESTQLVLQTLAIPAGREQPLLDARLTGDEKQQLHDLIRRRIDERIPLPYLTGIAWFAGLSFQVNEHVLIPRSPIAELIEQGFEPWLAGHQPHNILDLCTGGGCIGIACAHYFEEAEIDLADISSDALSVAQQNIQRYELDGRVQCQQSDLFDGLQGKRYDLIVSNPPYVDREDVESMPAEFLHEPALALACGDDGLDITRRILREAADYLTEEGVLVVEVGNSGMALEQAFPGVAFTWLEFERGGHGVFVFSRLELQHYCAEFSD